MRLNFFTAVVAGILAGSAASIELQSKLSEAIETPSYEEYRKTYYDDYCKAMPRHPAACPLVNAQSHSHSHSHSREGPKTPEQKQVTDAVQQKTNEVSRPGKPNSQPTTKTGEATVLHPH